MVESSSEHRLGIHLGMNNAVEYLSVANNSSSEDIVM